MSFLKTIITQGSNTKSINLVEKSYERYTITLGAPTTSGGKVISASANGGINGVSIALENDLISCPACKSQGQILCVGPRIPEHWNGKQVALENDLCLCGCIPSPRLVASQSLRCHVVEVTRGTNASSSVDVSAAEHSILAKVDEDYDLDFLLTDKVSGVPMVDWPYVIELAGGKHLDGAPIPVEEPRRSPLDTPTMPFCVFSRQSLVRSIPTGTIEMTQRRPVKTHTAKLTPVSDTKSEIVKVDDSSKLREIRALVEANNRFSVGTDVIICQIYMESRFDKDARAQGSSARGLMQLLKAPLRELARLKNLERPRKERRPEAELYAEADAFHDSPALADEAVNIRTGTAYLQALISKNSAAGATSPVVEAYKDYRGLRNGIYYDKIKAAAEKLSANPDSMEVLRDMVK